MKSVICERCGDLSFYGWTILDTLLPIPFHVKRDSLCSSCRSELDRMEQLRIFEAGRKERDIAYRARMLRIEVWDANHDNEVTER